MPDAQIRLKEVSKIYHIGKIEVHALRKVNLEIERGDFVVVLGSSGCGKTTMLNLIGGMDSPSGGSITVDGVDITGFDSDMLTGYRRKSIGFVFQFFNLIPTLTARENVELSAELARTPRDVMEVLDEVGIGGRADHFPNELSGGEQQRVAIARALAKNTPILLCDEPTGNLDSDTGRNVLSIMREINKKEEKTFILVTHNSVIANIADRVVHLHDGNVVKFEKNDSPMEPENLEW